MQRVLLDTCVLYPNYLRDTLLRLAEAELYEPLWSADILDELTRNVAERIGGQRAKGLVDVMAGAFPESLVSGYAALIPAMTNDPKDRHVLAAAIGGHAHAVVTLNLRDFPRRRLIRTGSRCCTPTSSCWTCSTLLPSRSASSCVRR
ncbi:PIN domain-containing protein [Streptomyces sp. NPDC059171]|uniref:PIN domain-containing protein n=1 Tax=Streptomyces sp. NPDC059171 TaxID=3346755 RepID=UPI0036B54476